MIAPRYALSWVIVCGAVRGIILWTRDVGAILKFSGFSRFLAVFIAVLWHLSAPFRIWWHQNEHLRAISSAPNASTFADFRGTKSPSQRHTVAKPAGPRAPYHVPTCAPPPNVRVIVST